MSCDGPHTVSRRENRQKVGKISMDRNVGMNTRFLEAPPHLYRPRFFFARAAKDRQL